MLRRVDINVANNTPVVKNGRTPKNLEGTAAHLKHFGRNPENDGTGKMPREKTTERTEPNGKKANEVKGTDVTSKFLKVMGERDAEMRFTYLPLKDKYEGTFAREMQLEEFVTLEDDYPKTGQAFAGQIDVFGDFMSENISADAMSVS